MRPAGCEHDSDAARIRSPKPRGFDERCSGLLFAREKLEQNPLPPDDADFVGRNLAKAQLAFGDALLTAFGQYHWSCRERQARLQCLSLAEAPPWFPEACRHHVAGVDFKLRPRRTPSSATELRAKLEELVAFGVQVWLWLESRRLGRLFSSAREYTLSAVNKCPETNPWRNRP
jgi:hypothetical protein